MDRRRVLLTVWNWLPAFQVVAETEHLPTASGRLKVTASALSRSITSLEDRLGRPLFTRRGRQLVLNADGRRLLAGMTTAFAALDESVASLSGAQLEGPLYASAAGPLAQSLVVPALRDLQARGQGLLPYVYGYDHDDAIRLLRSGQLDVVFDSTQSGETDLVTVFLGETANGIYCGREHPLFAARGVDERELLGQGFVVTCSAGGDRATDAFPFDVARRIDMFVHQMSVVLETCLAGHLLAVLPEFVARGFVREGALRHLPFGGLPPSPLYATYARAHATDARVRAVVAAVGEARVKAVEHDFPQGTASVHVAKVTAPKPPPGEDDWLVGGDALFARGELRAANAAYDDALVARRKLVGVAVVDDARHAVRIARLLVSEGKYKEAEQRCAEALAALAGGDTLVVASLEATAALACCFRGDQAKARDGLGRARALASAEVREGRTVDRMRVLVQRTAGNLLLVLGRPHDAIAAYREGADVAMAAGDSWEHSIAMFNLAEAHAVLGDVDRAGQFLEAAAREKEDIGDRWGLAHVHHLRARVALGDRRTDGAIEEATLALQLAAGLGDPKLVSTCNSTLGEAHLARGEREEARRAFELARRDAGQCDARAEVIRALVGLSAADLRLGDHASARRYAEEAHALARAGDARATLATTLVTLAEVASAEKKHVEAAALYRDALAVRQESGRGIP